MVKLVNENTQQFLYTPIGFSWENLFSGVFVPLYRGENWYFWLYTILGLFSFFILELFLPNPIYYWGLEESFLKSLFTEGLLSFVFMAYIIFYIIVVFLIYIVFNLLLLFSYNKAYIMRKLEQGWIPADSQTQDTLLANGITTEQNFEEKGENLDLQLYKPNRTGFYILLTFCILVILYLVITNEELRRELLFF